MKDVIDHVNRRRKPLALCMAVIFGASAFSPVCFAGTDIVLNCDDSGPGSLRDTIAHAIDGDIVDLNQVNMHCSVVTLAGGEIAVPQNNLQIKYDGNQQTRLRIEQTYTVVGDSYRHRIFHHTGTGTLKLQRLAIESGRYGGQGNHTAYFGSVAGGCVASSGVVDLENSSVDGCLLLGYVSLTQSVRGGGVYAARGLVLNHSTISNNTIGNAYGEYHTKPYSGGPVEGAGAFSNGYIQASYSTIDGNLAFSNKFNSAGGGVFVQNNGSATASLIQQSTISGNGAMRGGGLALFNHNAPMSIQNSTLADNGAVGSKYYEPGHTQGGAIFSFGVLNISNSTIADNERVKGEVYLDSSNYAVGISSSILHDKPTYDGVEIDSRSAITLSGKYNLIDNTSPLVTFSIPNGQSSGDPDLGLFGDHGGPTMTFALGPRSAALGNGRNSLNLSTDQRGAGYPRAAPNGVVDIGAYQDAHDRIFSDDFE